MKVTKYPWLVILVTAAITIYFGMQLPNLVFSNDVDKFLPANDPSRLLMDHIEEDFGNSESIVVGFTVKKGTITTGANLAKVAEITEILGLIDSVTDVSSITNTDYISGVDGGIETGDLVEFTPETSEEEADIKQRLRSWDLYDGMLYTPDFKSSVMIIETEEISQDRGALLYDEILKTLQPYEEQFDFHVAGSPILYALMSGNMQSDLRLLIPLVLLVVIITLFLSFKRISGVVLPVTAVTVSMIITLGLMAQLGIELTILATIIPVLLVAVGSAYGIHIITHYYIDMAEAGKDGKEVTHDEHTAVLNHTLKSVGQGVLLATLTTVAGFGSLATSNIVPVQEFGIFTAIGVAVAFLVAVLLIPALLQVKHSGAVKPASDTKGIDTLLGYLVTITKYKRIVMITAFSLVTFAVLMLSQLRIGDAMIHFFKKDTVLRQAVNWFDDNSNGTTVLNVRFESDEVGGLVEPQFLQTLDSMSLFLKGTFPEVGASLSFADFIKKLNEVVMVDEVDPDGNNFYEIPSDYAKYGLDSQEQLRPLISQYLMLFSGDLEDFVDDGFEPTITKSIIQLKTDDMQKVMYIVDSLEQWLSHNVPSGYTYELSGSPMMEISVTNLLVSSQTKSIIFSLMAVFIILAFYFRSFVAGTIGMIVLSIPVIFNFGVMALLGIPLDSSTSMIASIAIGIGIDYVIHFLNHYSLEMKKGLTFEEAAQNTIMASGKPILFNALSVAFGFMVLLFSQFVPLIKMGGMIALTMFVSSFVSLTVLPVIMIQLKPKYLLKNQSPKN